MAKSEANVAPLSLECQHQLLELIDVILWSQRLYCETFLHEIVQTVLARAVFFFEL